MFLNGKDGVNCTAWESCCLYTDPRTGECMYWDRQCRATVPVDCGDSSGTIIGTLGFGVTPEYAEGAGLEMVLTLRPGFDGSGLDAQTFHLRVLRGPQVLTEIEPGDDPTVVAPVRAGETLTFEMHAAEDDSDYFRGLVIQRYSRVYEFRVDVREPGFLRGDLNGDGDVDCEDFALFAANWDESTCVHPDWCQGADNTRDGQVRLADVLVLARNWLQWQ
jgi:hypothetical protein